MRNLRLLPALLLASCGTLFNNDREVVAFTSEPPGATVLVNGLPMGATPCQASLPAHSDQGVEFRLDGYHPVAVVIKSRTEAGWLVLDIFPGIILYLVPLVVDAITGDWKGLDQDSVHVVLIASTPHE